MKVYVLTAYYDNEGEVVIGAYSTSAKVEEQMKAVREKRAAKSYPIYELELDKPSR